MKIELWYDAVAGETDVLINDFPVEKNDVYGFLYPVRNYPLQSWLYPIGSWKGIEYHIKDLSRNEDVDLIFHGRECDYTDLKRSLAESENISPHFVEWDVYPKYKMLLGNLLHTVSNNYSTLEKLCLRLKMQPEHNININDINIPTDCIGIIDNDDDLMKIDDKSRICCFFVHDSFFTSYEKLNSLLTLTRSLEIPSDAIYCCFNDKQMKENYQYYAESFKRMGFHFCLGDDDYKETAFLKYSDPFELRQKIQKCREISEMVCHEFIRAKELTDDSFNKLTLNISSLNKEERECYEQIKQLRQKSGLFEVATKQVFEYIDTLFSVSKNNKNETFHYQCINKLEDNMNQYLKPFSEVI